MGVAKRCGCGAAFSRRAWDRLPSKGTSKDGRKYLLDFKDCPDCGSTLALPTRVNSTTPPAKATEVTTSEVTT